MFSEWSHVFYRPCPLQVHTVSDPSLYDSFLPTPTSYSSPALSFTPFLLSFLVFLPLSPNYPLFCDYFVNTVPLCYFYFTQRIFFFSTHLVFVQKKNMEFYHLWDFSAFLLSTFRWDLHVLLEHDIPKLTWVIFPSPFPPSLPASPSPPSSFLHLLLLF